MGDLPGDQFYSQAQGASADGKLIVGGSSATEGYNAITWTRRDGLTSLGDLQGGPTSSWAYAVSPDGRVIVGQGWSDNGGEAFRWTAESGMVGLGDDPQGHFQSWARDVSADGSIVIGMADGGPYRYFGAGVWEATHGMRSLMRVLEEQFGLDMSDWNALNTSYAVSGDGFRIVGSAERSDNRAIEAYMVRLPCLEFCDRCSFSERLSVEAQPDNTGGYMVTARLRDAKPGAEIALRLSDALWVNLLDRQRTVDARGRAKARWHGVTPGCCRVALRECDVSADVICP